MFLSNVELSINLTMAVPGIPFACSTSVTILLLKAVAVITGSFSLLLRRKLYALISLLNPVISFPLIIIDFGERSGIILIATLFNKVTPLIVTFANTDAVPGLTAVTLPLASTVATE